MKLKNLHSLSLLLIFSAFLFLQNCKQTTPLNKEQILSYFSENEMQLKEASTEFLLKNMYSKNSFSGEALSQTDKLYQELATKFTENDTMNIAIARKIFESTKNKYNQYIQRSSLVPISDSSLLSNKALAQHIENKVNVYKNASWKNKISLKVFFEFLLPYNAINETPELELEQNIFAKYQKFTNLHPDDPYEVAKEILKFQKKHFIIDHKIGPQYASVTKTSNLINGRVGDCKSFCQMMVHIFRSVGIPATVDFIPNWANRDERHFWLSVMDKNGNMKDLEGSLSLQREVPASVVDFWKKEDNRRMPKVYRYQYSNDESSKNQEIEESNAFELPHVLDVTSQYVKTYDVDIQLFENLDSTKVYICTFGSGQWTAAAKSNPIYKNKSRLNRLVDSVMYLPMIQESNGFVAVGHPFWINSQGQIQEIIPSENKKTKLNVFRKYPLFPRIKAFHDRLFNARFQASHDSTFKKIDWEYTVKCSPERTMQIPVKTSSKLKYWRLIFPDKICDIADFSFVSEKDSIRFESCFLKDSKKQTELEGLKNAFDGNLSTFFSHFCKAKGSEIRLNVLNCQSIKALQFCPRTDLNTIQKGDEYELFYWNNTFWQSLESKVAKNISLNFGNVPEGGLYLLKNLSNGKEERIFQYLNDKQIFY